MEIPTIFTIIEYARIVIGIAICIISILLYKDIKKLLKLKSGTKNNKRRDKWTPAI
jgi:hypothetical protein